MKSTEELRRLEAAGAVVQEVALDYIAAAFNRTDREPPRHCIPRRDDDHDARLMDYLRDVRTLPSEVIRLRELVERMAARLAGWDPDGPLDPLLSEAQAATGATGGTGGGR